MTSGPASQELMTAALGAALRSVGIDGPVTLLSRRENVYESTHRSEVLDCRVGGLGLPAILCKYGPSEDRDHLGLRHGLDYEADVYRVALGAELEAPPRFFGAYADPGHRLTWLFLEYLDQGWQLDLGPETAIVDAAAMLGDLQRTASSSLAGGAKSLNIYDERYFRRCLAAAETQAARWGDRVPGFGGLLAQFDAAIPHLLSSPPTMVHGEFTPHNVVWAHERPRVVDWEQAALGAGEIDLAALTDEWDEDLVAPATDAYLDSRWPAGPEHDFAASLEAARLYWLFRWLGDPEQAGTEEEIAWLTARANQAAAS